MNAAYGRHVGGRSGENINLAPPFNITSDEIEMIVDRLGTALDKTLSSL